MTNEQLQLANHINNKIETLENEIFNLMDIEPSIRNCFEDKNKRGWFQRIKGRSLIAEYARGGNEFKIELSNEDIRALIDIRTAESQALKSVLDKIGN